MTHADSHAPSTWNADWESHQLAQRQRLARLSLVEKLAWLEEAQRVVAALTFQPGGVTPPPERP